MVFTYVINQKYVKLLNYIRKKNPNMRQIAKETQISYPKVRDIVLSFQESMIIEPVFGVPNRTQRDYNIILNWTGLEVLKQIERIERIIKEAQNDKIR